MIKRGRIQALSFLSFNANGVPLEGVLFRDQNFKQHRIHQLVMEEDPDVVMLQETHWLQSDRVHPSHFLGYVEVARSCVSDSRWKGGSAIFARENIVRAPIEMGEGGSNHPE